MQNVFLSLIVICMYFSIFVIIIPVYADDQDYGEILTVGFHLPPPLINLNPPEIYPEPIITDIEGENFKLYSHEFFTIKIPENFVYDKVDRACSPREQLCNYGKWFYASLPEDFTPFDSVKKRQMMSISFQPYYRYNNIVDLTNDATFDVPYILDEMQSKGYMKYPFSNINAMISNCSYNQPPLDYGCKNLVINDARFMNINGMPAFQIEFESDWKPPAPYSTEHYKYDEETDKKLRNFEHVSEITTTIFTKGFTISIYAGTTHSDYVKNPASWNDIVNAANSFDTINDVHKITDSTVFERIEQIQNNFDDTLEINSNQMEKLTQIHVPITLVTDASEKVQSYTHEPEPPQLEIVCGAGTVMIDHICQVQQIEEEEKEIPIEKAVDTPVEEPVKEDKKSGGWFSFFYDWFGSWF